MRLLPKPPTHSNTGPVPNADFNADSDFNADPDADAHFNAGADFNADSDSNELVQGQSQIRPSGFGGTELIAEGTSMPTIDVLVNMR